METTENRKKNKKSRKSLVLTTLLIVLLVAVVATAGTAAWFTIASHTRISTMKMYVVTGPSLRIDTVPHETFEEYVNAVTAADISNTIKEHLGYDFETTPLEPVTTRNGIDFTLEHGEKVRPESGYYLEFTLHFMGEEDMLVHLSSANSYEQNDGTKIWSDENPVLARVMRMSFTSEQGTFIYNPREGKNYATPDFDNVLFELEEGKDLPVVVRIWLEGNDRDCTNDLKGKDYHIRLRFEGTDFNNKPLI